MSGKGKYRKERRRQWSDVCLLNKRSVRIRKKKRRVCGEGCDFA